MQGRIFKVTVHACRKVQVQKDPEFQAGSQHKGTLQKLKEKKKKKQDTPGKSDFQISVTTLQDSNIQFSTTNKKNLKAYKEMDHWKEKKH